MSPVQPLRIAITTDPEIPVPPTHYGGIERIVDLLVRGLVKRGHDVTLFAHRDSDVPCTIVPYPGLESQSKRDLLFNMWTVSSKVLRQPYDLVHSFGRLAYLLLMLPLRMPKLMSYQRPASPRSVSWGERLARGTLNFSVPSRFLLGSFAGRANWYVVHNGVPIATYDFRDQVDDGAPLMFLGKVEDIKGPHLAIEVALRSGRSLVIAGNVPDGPQHRAFFDEKISPHVDGKMIQYVGPVTDVQKNDLLGGAAAFLMPVLWDEGFGIVMAEALACGTPIIGLNRGAMPEVVEDGVNGFLCESVDEMVAAVGRIQSIDRRACRRVAELKFSDQAIVDAYEELYRKVLDNGT